MRSSSHTLAKRYFVRGRVQGVCFRAFVQKHATNIGMAGYTRNLDDGRVEVYAIGTPSQHNELCGHLRMGPPMSDVRGLEELEATLERVSGFRVAG